MIQHDGQVPTLPTYYSTQMLSYLRFPRHELKGVKMESAQSPVADGANP